MNTFWDDIAYDARPKLARIDHRLSRNTMELRLLSQTSQLLRLRLPQFVTELRAWMAREYMGNSNKFWTTYVVLDGPDTAQIWHTNVEGKPDRHLCTITKLPDHDVY